MPHTEDRLAVRSLSSEQLYAALETRPEGLSSREAAERLERYGPNEIREAKGTPMWLKFASNFYHLFALLLWVGAVLAFVGGLPQLGYAIIAVIIINAVFSFWQEFRAEKATEALKELIPQVAKVMRDAEIHEVQAREVVPGDVLLLEEGDNVSADARVVEEFDLRVNQATLNGESAPARRSSAPVSEEFSSPTEIPNLVFAGTSVVYGRGRAIVSVTGMDTQFGKVAALTQGIEEGLSPLQREMNQVTRIVATLAVALGVTFFILGYFVAGLGLVAGFLFAVGIIVANVPEGLLPTVTLALALGVQRMARRHALVKKLSAVETLGSTTVICTDKTGTLTANEMTVRDLWTAEGVVEVTGVGYAPEGELLVEGRPPGDETRALLTELLRGGAYANNARLREPSGDQGWRIVGDPTEGALLVSARKAGFDVEAESASSPRVFELPFDSVRKRMSTVHETKDRRRVLYVKGAPKEVIGLSESVLTAGGPRPLDDATRDAAVRANDDFARSGLRVLAVAMRELSPDESPYGLEPETAERGLTLLGLQAMMDPPRPEVEQVVAQTHTAGIKVIMVTGDYGLTAESIARRIGIVRGEHPRIVIGSDLEVMDEAALEEALAAEEVIFARVAPEHKMRIAQALKAMGETVAMTGDGVNDAPALKAADIGVAMGRSGTDVAREAADMILTDDNFASIVHAIEEGRAVYDNIRRFVSYIFTSNVPEIVPFILFVLFRIPLPLTVLQILAIDLGTDMVPAIALSTEAPEPGVMERPPRRKGERLLSRKVLARAYLFLGLIQTAATMAAYFYLYYSRGWRPGEPLADSGTTYVLATTMTLAAVVFTQIGNGFAQRASRKSVLSIGLFTNRFLLWGILVEVALMAAISYLPFLQSAFGTGPLRVTDWLFVAALSPVLLVADELRKVAVRRWFPPPGGARVESGAETPSGADLGGRTS